MPYASAGDTCVRPEPGRSARLGDDGAVLRPGRDIPAEGGVDGRGEAPQKERDERRDERRGVPREEKRQAAKAPAKAVAERDATHKTRAMMCRSQGYTRRRVWPLAPGQAPSTGYSCVGGGPCAPAACSAEGRGAAVLIAAGPAATLLLSPGHHSAQLDPSIN